MGLQRLENIQRQNLIPTQRMQFALTVLAMSYQEMDTRLKETLQDNILLEESAPDEHEVIVEDEMSERHYTAQGKKGTKSSRRKDGDESHILEHRTVPVTLNMVLEQQVGEAFETEEEKDAARWIIGNLNERGHLETGVEELAESGGMPLELLERVRQRLMRLSPTGCGAQGWGECLAVQALERWGEAAGNLAGALQHSPRRLLSAEYMEREARRLGMPGREHLLCELRRLNPAPGLQYVTDAPYAPPADIRFREEGGKWIVDINLPDMEGWRLRSEYHHERLDSETRRFLLPYMRNLRFWRYALRVRRDTLQQMAQWLLDYQMEFVRHGPRYLEPARMTTAAEQLGVSVSTVSRCVQNKILHFAWGTFPFRDVFRDVRMQRPGVSSRVESSATAATAGKPKVTEWDFPVPYFPGMESPAGMNGYHHGKQGPENGQTLQLHEHVVREALLKILEEESADCVYPDEVLAVKLKERGIPVSRRCLARYRQRWGIGHRGERLLQYRFAEQMTRKEKHTAPAAGDCDLCEMES